MDTKPENHLRCPYCGCKNTTDAPASSDETLKAQRLLDDMGQMQDAIADEHGQDVPYCTSMDFSLFPSVVLLILSREDEVNDILTDLRFLAENGNKFPESLEKAGLEDFRKYTLANRDSILDEIRSNCESDYEDCLGFPFKSSRFHCPECDRYFDEEDIEFEGLRHRISAFCSQTGADEQHPRLFPAVPVSGNGSVDPTKDFRAIGAFHDPEARVWFVIRGYDEPVNIDDLSLPDLKRIYREGILKDN